jgi:hypothetical protein
MSLTAQRSPRLKPQQQQQQQQQQKQQESVRINRWKTLFVIVET